jgi:hypothetical protein
MLRERERERKKMEDKLEKKGISIYLEREGCPLLGWVYFSSVVICDYNGIFCFILKHCAQHDRRELFPTQLTNMN